MAIEYVDSTQLDADLTSVANAIRTKSGGSSQLAFPAGFVSEIQAIPSGGGGIGNALYTLPSETVFNGTSTFIDTGVKLLETADTEFTILFTATNGSSIGANAPIFHCVTERDPYPGLSLQRKARGNTDYYAVSLGGQKQTTAPITSGTVLKFVIRRKQGVEPSTILYDFWYTVNGEIQTEMQVYNSTTTNKNLLIGCYQSSDGTKGRFWSGIMSDFTIRDTYVPDSYVQEYLTGVSTAQVLNALLGE